MKNKPHAFRCLIKRCHGIFSICCCTLLCSLSMQHFSAFILGRPVRAEEIYEEIVDDIVDDTAEDISIELPTVSDQIYSSFDFSLDPFCLFADYPLTDDDGRTMEPGANFYFRNTEGEYAYSHVSDEISINNHQNSPFLISVYIQMSEVPGLSYITSAEVDDFTGAAVSLAVVDENGNTYEMDENGTISFVRTIDSAFSFKLAGRCSSSDDWADITSAPYLSVKWQICSQNSEIVNNKDDADDQEREELPDIVESSPETTSDLVEEIEELPDVLETE